MDSLTHLLLGGAIAAAMAPARFRRAAMVAGALINSLPDIDALPLALVDDPVAVMVWHRSATHSLFVLPFVGIVLWWMLRAHWAPVRENPRRWFWLIQATLLAHPLLDAFTIYGTQLWWPLTVAPSMWSSLFIIDPLFSLPLLTACVLGWCWKEQRRARWALLTGLLVSAGYLGWSQLAKRHMDNLAGETLAAMGLEKAPRFSVPMPFNTLLWRIVAMTPGGFVETEYSLVSDSPPLRFRHYRSDGEALESVANFPAVQRLVWFTHGFLKAEQRDGQLVLSDLRMGAEPDYSFRFAIAQRKDDHWQPMPPRQLEWPWAASRRLPGLWKRMWHTPTDGKNP